MILEDDNAVGINIEMMHRTLRVMNEDNKSTIQTMFKMMIASQNSHKQSIKHQCHENRTTINSVLHQNVELSFVKSFPNIESGGTFLTMVTNNNSKNQFVVVAPTDIKALELLATLM